MPPARPNPRVPAIIREDGRLRRLGERDGAGESLIPSDVAPDTRDGAEAGEERGE